VLGILPHLRCLLLLQRIFDDLGDGSIDDGIQIGLDCVPFFEVLTEKLEDLVVFFWFC
jgi:hypothetical protein